MRMGVIGATGRIGARVCALAHAAGHSVIGVSRGGDRHASWPAGVTPRRGDITSAGDMRALVEECDVVFDLIDARTKPSRLPAGARNLVACAQAAASPPLIIGLGIIGAERSRAGYHRAKAEQAAVYTACAHARVLRAGQLFSLLTDFFSSGGQLACVPYPARAVFQPVSEDDVAAELVRASAGTAPQQWRLVGPEVLSARDAAERFRDAARPHQTLVPLWVPGALGRFLRSGDNLDASAPTAPTRFPGTSRGV